MPNRGDSRALYSVEAVSEVVRAGRIVTKESGTVLGPIGAVTGAAGAGAMTLGEDVPLAVTAVLPRPV